MVGKTPHELELAGTDSGAHATLAQALTDAAHYIRSHPELPIPLTVEINYTIAADNDKAGDDKLFAIAAALGAPVTGDEISETRLSFGPVCYRATYITREHMAAYNAHMEPYHAARSARREDEVAA